MTLQKLCITFCCNTCMYIRIAEWLANQFLQIGKVESVLGSMKDTRSGTRSFSRDIVVSPNNDNPLALKTSDIKTKITFVNNCKITVLKS